MNPQTETATLPDIGSDALELICRCDWEKAVCAHVRQCGGCTHDEPRFRPRVEIEAADAKRMNSLLPLILKLAPEASGKIP